MKVIDCIFKYIPDYRGEKAILIFNNIMITKNCEGDGFHICSKNGTIGIGIYRCRAYCGMTVKIGK